MASSMIAPRRMSRGPIGKAVLSSAPITLQMGLAGRIDRERGG